MSVPFAQFDAPHSSFPLIEFTKGELMKSLIIER